LLQKIYSRIPIPLQYPKLQYLRNTSKLAKYRSKSILNTVSASFSTVGFFGVEKKIEKKELSLSHPPPYNLRIIKTYSQNNQE